MLYVKSGLQTWIKQIKSYITMEQVREKMILY